MKRVCFAGLLSLAAAPSAFAQAKAPVMKPDAFDGAGDTCRKAIPMSARRIIVKA